MWRCRCQHHAARCSPILDVLLHGPLEPETPTPSCHSTGTPQSARRTPMLCQPNTSCACHPVAIECRPTHIQSSAQVSMLLRCDCCSQDSSSLRKVVGREDRGHMLLPTGSSRSVSLLRCSPHPREDRHSNSFLQLITAHAIWR